MAYAPALGSLAQNGCVVLAAHNTAVSIEKSNYDLEADPLRKAVNLVARRLHHSEYFRTLNVKRFTRNEVEEAFLSQRYVQQKCEDANFKLTMADRLRMWRTPAVLNDLLAWIFHKQ